MLCVQRMLLAGVGTLAVALSGPAWSANGKLGGFGNIPFGTEFEAAKRAKGLEIRDETCNPTLCQLVYRTTVSDLPVTVWQTFVERRAGDAEIQIRSTGEQGRFVSASRCDATFNRVYVMLRERYGEADLPVVQRLEPTQSGMADVREVTFSFSDGAQIREKRDVTEDGTCAVRVFYRPSAPSGGDAAF
jgi:hypothetical protein